MSSQVHFPERRIVLLGKTGVGKSASANTILGEKRFRSEFSLSSVTGRCEMYKAEVAGRMVSLVDTPGLFDTSYSNDVIAKEIARSVFLSSPGPHALLYVLKADRFTTQEEDVVQVIEKIFGEEMRKYMMVLFTCGDQLEGKKMHDLIKKHKPLKRLIDQCGGGYHVFNNKDQSNRAQVNELMKKIDRMVEKNGGSCYTNEMLEDADKMKLNEQNRAMEEATRKQKQLMYEKEVKHQQESEESAFSKFWEKYKTHFIWGAAFLVGAVVGGVVGVGVGVGVGVEVGAGLACCIAGSTASGVGLGAASCAAISVTYLKRKEKSE